MRRVLLACVATALGCFLGGGAPDQASSAAIGPAPLRRLTNDEYLNALHDLFPSVTATLPPLPADAIIGGFDNAASAQAPSDVLIARYETIANLYAAGATADDASVTALVGCDWSTDAAKASCGAQFIQQTGRRIFRRPLEQDEITRFETKFAGYQSAVDFEGAVQLTLSTMLQSPQFIYRAEPVENLEDASAIIPANAYEVATRLSFLLWSSTPDDALLAAADSGALDTDDGIRAQATRMLKDDRARRTFWNFHRQWLGLDLIVTTDQTYRTPDIDPDWTAQTPVSAENETELFVENTLMAGGTLHDLLTSNHAWVDGEMSRVYKLPTPSDPTTFSPVDLPNDQRAGLLTRVAFLAGTSHSGGTSPPIRGNAVQLHLLCALPISPPPNADTSMPTAPPGSGPQTTRMLFEQRTAPAQCQSCHASLNGIGFGFEEYDAAGAYRTTENGLPIDATGTLMGTDVDGPFDGALALSAKLDSSTVVHQCATQEWLRYALGRAPVAAEQPLVDAWTKSFIASGGDVRALLMSIVTSPTFRYRRANDQ